tara:strand:+ start:55 stop:750 length:696 start_codon:yes stop_codon:yes gene_type:complete
MGAGVQTTALLLEFWQNYDLVIFADTGEEQKETINYISDYLKPFCKSKNLEWVTVRAKTTLMEHCLKQKIIPIITRRWCTHDFKVRPIQRELRKRGATKKNPIICSIGISIDEAHRANFNSGVKYQVLEYPLIDAKLSRADCYKIIEKHGYPIPPKSGCDLCPFFSKNHFRKLAKKNPERFKKIVEMEKNSYSYGKYYLKGKYPLQMILDNTSLDEFSEYDDSCDSGHCFN